MIQCGISKTGIEKHGKDEIVLNKSSLRPVDRCRGKQHEGKRYIIFLANLRPENPVAKNLVRNLSPEYNTEVTYYRLGFTTNYSLFFSVFLLPLNHSWEVIMTPGRGHEMGAASPWRKAAPVFIRSYRDLMYSRRSGGTGSPGGGTRAAPARGWRA